MTTHREKQEIQMAFAISEIVKQQKSATGKPELEALSKTSSDYFFQPKYSVDTVRIHRDNQPTQSQSETIRKHSKEDSVSPHLATRRDTSTGDYDHSDNALRSKWNSKDRAIRTLNASEEKERGQKFKPKTTFVKKNNTEELMNTKFGAFNHINKDKSNQHSLEGLSKLRALSIQSPKGTLHGNQRRPLNFQLKKSHHNGSMEQKVREPSSSREDYYTLCKTLRLDKIITDSKKNSLTEEYDKQNLSERLSIVKPELSLVLKNLTKEADEYLNLSSSMVDDKRRNSSSSGLPVIAKEKNIHMEKLKLITKNTSSAKDLSKLGRETNSLFRIKGTQLNNSPYLSTIA